MAETTTTITEPTVFKDEEVYVGMFVYARPFYHVPESRCSLSRKRSPFTFEARVIERVGEMWTVEFTWEAYNVPWPKSAVFFAKELHKGAKSCACAACEGDGIQAIDGA